MVLWSILAFGRVIEQNEHQSTVARGLEGEVPALYDRRAAAVLRQSRGWVGGQKISLVLGKLKLKQAPKTGWAQPATFFRAVAVLMCHSNPRSPSSHSQKVRWHLWV
jgi:hypothetical protein